MAGNVPSRFGNRPHQMSHVELLRPAAVYRSCDVTVAIPTFEREQVLVDTVRACLADSQPAGQIIVVDQTRQHNCETERALQSWHDAGQILWERQALPSVPKAMNHSLITATRPLVLFLDDDIVPQPGFIAAHAAAHGDPDLWAVVGQIIQPWQEPSDVPIPESNDTLCVDFDFPFHTSRKSDLQNVMAGHLSVVRERALDVGGFDENFKGAAYRFETEFARRLRRAGGRISFDPGASIRHLRVQRGGTRSYGNHLASASANHGVGDYYFALLHGWKLEVIQYVTRRMFREVCTRFHLKRPWFIPVKLVGEIRALCWACQLKRRGPALLQRSAK